MNRPKSNIENLIQKFFLIAFGVVIFGLILFAGVSVFFLAPVEINNEEYVEFVVAEGWSKNTIATKLEAAGLIRSAFFFKFYMRINDQEMYAGTYKISKSMSTHDIIKVLNSTNSLENETIMVTFIEGKRLTSYVKQISEVFGYAEDEILTKLSDETYLKTLINKYWFITEDILKPEIYYPLEGYLFPDTYLLKKSATIEEIIAILLDTMGSKLMIYQEEIALLPFSIHDLLTLASIVELEGINPIDRAGVAGVFYNRINTGGTLGSDVTTYYAVKKDFSVDLSMKDLKTCNAYNTRAENTCAFSGLPIGPIAGASLSSITAAIEPEINSYYYFVADKNNQTHFSKTYSEHVATINRLKNDGLWFQY